MSQFLNNNKKIKIVAAAIEAVSRKKNTYSLEVNRKRIVKKYRIGLGT